MSTLPPHLEVDLASFDRRDFDEDFERCMEFFGDVLRVGGGPARLDPLIAKAIEKGYLTPAGDVTMDAYDGPPHWDISDLD